MVYIPRTLKQKSYTSSDQRNLEADSWTEDRVLKSLVVTETPLVVDIGAYTGTSASRFRTIFPSCSLVCFEPNPEALQELTRTSVNLGGDIQVIGKAVSDIDGYAPLHVQGIDPALSGLVRRNSDSKDSIDIARAKSSNAEYLEDLNVRELMVESVTLDTCFGFDSRNIDLMKIDVQGVEARVLNGGPRTLRRVENLLIEVSFYDFYESQSSFRSVEELLEPAGLYLWAITKNSRNPMNGRTDWANAVYRRQ